MAVEGADPKGCAFMIGMAALIVGAIVMVAMKKGEGQVEFEAASKAYLDALVAGEWERASELDHPDRKETAEQIAAAWKDRESRLGDLESWELWVADPGFDPDGEFVLAKVRLGFEDLAGPMVVRVTVRPGPDGPRIRQISSVKGVHIHEETF